jgi:hypothetical protein
VADSRPKHSGCKSSDFDYGKSEGSFIFRWGTSDFPNSIRFRIKRSTGGKWLISVEDNNRAKIGTAMSLDTALQASDGFAEIRWFTEDEEDGRGGTGAAHCIDTLSGVEVPQTPSPIPNSIQNRAYASPDVRIGWLFDGFSNMARSFGLSSHLQPN